VVGTAAAPIIKTLRDNLGDEPEWLFGLGLIIFCYATGHVVVAAGYTFFQMPYTKLFGTMITAAGRPAAPPDRSELLKYRYLYPALFLEIDRREPLVMLRIGLPVALLFAAYFIDVAALVRLAIAIVSLAFVVNGYWGQREFWLLQEQTLKAARDLEKKKVPYYAWKSPKEKNAD